MARPLKYTPEDFWKAIAEYINKCVELEKLPTKSGVLLSLGTTRETWREYKEKEEFVDAIKNAELLIEEAWVQRLTGNNVVGAIFYLKNAFKEEYRDRHETDITSGGDKIIPIYNVSGDNSIKENSETEEKN